MCRVIEFIIFDSTAPEYAANYKASEREREKERFEDETKMSSMC